MPLRDRIGLIFVMCLSLITMVMSILKTYYISTAAHATQASVDVQYNAIFQVLFGVLEQDIVIIMGCIPSIRHVVAIDLKVFNSLGSSITSFIKRSRTKGSGSDSTNPSTVGYYDLEDQTNKKSGTDGISQNKGSTVITSYPKYGSRDDLVPENQVRRTHEVMVSSDPKNYTQGGNL